MDCSKTGVKLTCSFSPVFIALILSTEVAMTSVTSHVFFSFSQMYFHLITTLKSHETSQAYKLVSDRVIVLKMIAQAPPVLERAQAEIAEDVMIHGIVDMILQPIPVFEDAPA